MPNELRLLDPVNRRAVASLLASVAAELVPFADSLAAGDVLDREDLRFDGYGEAAVVFINRRLLAKGLHLDAEHPLCFLVRASRR